MAKRRIIFVSVVCLSIAAFSVQTLSQTANVNRTANTSNIEGSRFNKKVAESINVRWRSIEYEKTLYNPALTSNKQGQPKAEDLSLSFDVGTLYSGLILSTCPDAVIEQITDSWGNNIESGPFSSGSSLMYVHIPRFDGGFMPSEGPGGPELATLRVRLDAGLRERISGEIGLKGYFYALTADSLEYVELPFKPSDKWVRLTPDVEIRVRKTRNEASRYLFDIEQRPEKVTDLSRVQIGDYLPSRLIVDRQFIAKTSATGAGGGYSTGRIGGEGAGIGRAEKIRYIIAVNPAHQKIPFEIERIPLSALNEPVPSQISNSNRLKPALVGRQMQTIARRSTRSRAQRMPEQVKPQFNKEVADCFEVNWSSIIYRKILYNPVGSGKSRSQRVSEKLSVRCEARILDPKLIIGTCEIPVIERITDDKGRNTDISKTQPRSNRMYYSTLHYTPSHIQPSSLFFWEGRARLALGLPLRARNLPKRDSVLQPVRMLIQLDPGLLRQDKGEIRSIKGCFHALTAESSKHVEVPFKPSNRWVRLTSDLEIQVARAWHDGFKYRYKINERSKAQINPGLLNVYCPLPDGILVERRLTGPDMPAKREDRAIGPHSLPEQAGGNGFFSRTIDGNDCTIDTIDYRIAVGPAHYRIPIELEHIPLPEP